MRVTAVTKHFGYSRVRTEIDVNVYTHLYGTVAIVRDSQLDALTSLIDADSILIHNYCTWSVFTSVQRGADSREEIIGRHWQE